MNNTVFPHGLVTLSWLESVHPSIVVLLGVATGLLTLGLMAHILAAILKRHSHKVKYDPQHIMKNAMRRMVQDDVQGRHFDHKSLRHYLPTNFPYEDLTRDASFDLAKMYRTVLKEAEEEHQRQRKAERLFEQLEYRRHHYLEQLDAVLDNE